VLDQGLDWSSVINEIIEKKYIAVGFIALLGLLPLALTSNRWSIRKLGKKWKPLHRLVYPLTLLVIVHFLWQVKANDIVEPAMYLAVLLLLLVWRFRKMLS
jgi:sulfoxide reductase heme-binding subunit YedZ